MKVYLFFWVFQEKEAYRWAIKETIKSMLAFGWTIERTKEGDPFGTHTCTRRVSQSGQVCSEKVISFTASNSFFTCFLIDNQSFVICSSCLLKEHQHSAPNLWTWAASPYHGISVSVIQLFSDLYTIKVGTVLLLLLILSHCRGGNVGLLPVFWVKGKGVFTLCCTSE